MLWARALTLSSVQCTILFRNVQCTVLLHIRGFSASWMSPGCFLADFLPPGCLLAASWLLRPASGCPLAASWLSPGCFWLLAACSWLPPGCAFGLPRQRVPTAKLERKALVPTAKFGLWLPPGSPWLLLPARGCLLAFGVPRQRVPAAKLGSKIYSSLQKATPGSKIQKRKRALSEEKV